MSDRRTWPTPQASDWRSGWAQKWEEAMTDPSKKRSRDLRDAVAHDAMTAQPSSPSSPEWEGSTSASSEPDGAGSPKSSGSPTASASSPSTGPMWPDMETSTTSTDGPPARDYWPTPMVPNGGRSPKGGAMSPTGMTPDGKKRQVDLAWAVREGLAPTASPTSTSSPAASLANLSAMPASSSDSQTIVGYGPSSSDAFASYDPATSSWRTSQASLWEEGWGQSSEGWPTSGTMRNGRAFRRRPLVPRTSVTGSGSWPTPTVNDRPNEGSVRLLRARVLDGTMTEEEATAILRGKSPFESQGKLEMWHTPTASDSDGKPRWDHRASPGYVRAKPVPNLMAQIQEREMFLTPSANEDAAGRPGAAMQKMLGNDPRVRESGAGTLNPDWVSLLMGFPVDWLHLGDQDGKTVSRVSRKASPTASTDSER